MTQPLDCTLHNVFGFHQFRGHQREIIEQLVKGCSAMVVMATGSGKSLCYQLPSLLRDGVGIVISPLIALMKDQVTELEQLGVAAACLYTGQSWQQQQEIEQQLKMGALDILYLSPEKLMSHSTLQQLHEIDIALFAIDEAHCIWSWGDYFRPEYQQLNLLATEFPRIPRIALTATASQQCREAIIQQLSLEDAQIYDEDIDRNNLIYWVQPKQRGNKQLLEFILCRHKGHSGIVYCSTRKQVEELQLFLSAENIACESYHAGIEASDRWKIQQRFMTDETSVIVATVAFGLGINKPDVRFVAHMGLPQNLDAYLQETGRAGRDGQEADVWMLFGLRDYQRRLSWILNEETFEEKRQFELQQLHNMMDYILDHQCRRKKLFEYYSPKHQRQDCACHQCDNCFFVKKTTEITEDARKALSAVHHCKGQLGVDSIIKILRGKKLSNSMALPLEGKNGNKDEIAYQSLSVYGLGAEQSTDYWRSVFWKLILEGAVCFQGEYCELIKLAPSCKALLKGEETLHQSGLKYFTTQDFFSHKYQDEYKNHPLYKKLQSLRSALATKLSLYQYQLFSDETLQQLVEKMPQNISQLSVIEGMGKMRAQKYADEIFGLIQQYKDQKCTELKHVLLDLPQIIDPQAIEHYAVTKALTLQEVDQQFSEYLRLGLVHPHQILPFPKEKIQAVIAEWTFQTDLSGRVEAQQFYKNQYESHWFNCFCQAQRFLQQTNNKEAIE